jgi:uncharacterized membrane-anchored protein YitT (DUF2179 family)
MNRAAMRKELRTTANVLLGTALVVVAIAYFIDPVKLYTGGFSGLSQLIVNIVEAATGGAVKINLGILLYGFQIPMILLGWFKLSRKFILYTILSVTLTSLFLALPIGYAVMGDDLLGSSIFGGILLGLGNGVLLHAGASSGGTTIPFQYLSIKTGKSVGLYQIMFNAVIIGIAGIRFGFPVAIYTIVCQMISSLMIDKIHTGYNFMKLEIVTDRGEEVAAALVQKVPHGITALDATGMYSLQSKKMLYTVISVHEVQRYVAIVKDVDPKAFIVMTGVTGVRGNFAKKIIS